MTNSRSVAPILHCIYLYGLNDWIQCKEVALRIFFVSVLLVMLEVVAWIVYKLTHVSSFCLNSHGTCVGSFSLVIYAVLPKDKVQCLLTH